MPRLPPLGPCAAFLTASAAALFLFSGPDKPAGRGGGPAAAAECDGEAATDWYAYRIQAGVCRDHARRRIARALIAGRLTLAEAAGRFRDLDEVNPDFREDLFRRAFRGTCDDERRARQVIAEAAREYPGPRQTCAVAARLEAELDLALRHGTFRLPP